MLTMVLVYLPTLNWVIYVGQMLGFIFQHHGELINGILYLHWFSEKNSREPPDFHVWFGVHLSHGNSSWLVCDFKEVSNHIQKLTKLHPTTSCQEVIGLLGSLVYVKDAS